MNKTVLFDGIKSVPISDEVPGYGWAWKQLLGGGVSDDAQAGRRSYTFVSAVRRAVNMRANAMQIAPRHWYRLDGTEIDEADVPYGDAMPDLLWRLNASIDMFGAGYALNAKNDKLRWWVSDSVTLKTNELTGTYSFVRHVGTKQAEFKAEDVLHIWLPSPFEEIGPGPSLMQAALNAAGVIVSVHEFNRAFFARGAIAPQLLTFPEGQGITPEESKQLKEWFRQAIQGVRNAFRTEVVRRKVESVKLGVDDLRSLETTVITEDQQKQVALAFEMPYTLLYSGAANYATAREDTLTFWDGSMRARAALLQRALNDQVLMPRGLRLEFGIEEMAPFQEDETRRAASLAQLITAEVPRDMALEQLGYKMTDELRTRVRMAAMMASGMQYDGARRVFEQAEVDMLDNPLVTMVLDALRPVARDVPAMQPGARETQRPQIAQTLPGNPEASPDRQPTAPAKADLDKWQRKALKALRAGKPASVPFESEHLDEAEHGAISGALDAVITADEVKAVFAQFGAPNHQEDTKPNGDDMQTHVHIHLPAEMAVKMAPASQPIIRNEIIVPPSIVNVPKADAPVINNNVTVTPEAPIVNATFTTPKPIREEQTVERGADGMISKTVTEIKYKNGE